MITRQQVDQLLQFKNSQYLVTSCYLNLDRGQMPPQALKIRVKDLLQSARHSLHGKAGTHEQRQSLQRDFERIEEYVQQDILGNRHKALAAFSCDGEKFWLYDTDLNQVTVKKLDAALGSSPAALLSGNNEIERGFVLKDMGSREGLDWLQATPRTSETSFQEILMAFDAQSNLAIMELHDAFGHKTVLRFTSMQRNPQLSSGLFKFVPPEGADILGE